MMKKTNLLFILFAIFVIGCTENGGEMKPETIVISAKGGSEFKTGVEVVFTIKNGSGEDVSSSAKVYVNDDEIKGNKHIFTEVGTYKVHAKLKDKNVISKKIDIIIKPGKMTGIVISAEGGNEVVESTVVNFTVKDNFGQDLPKEDEIVIVVNDERDQPNEFLHTFDKVGTYKVYAEYLNIKDDKIFKSNEITITVKPDNVKRTHTAKAIIHDFTGSWCWLCPHIALVVDRVYKEMPNQAIPVAVHCNSSSSENPKDPYAYSNYKVFGVEGYPTFYMNNVVIPSQSVNVKPVKEAINNATKDKKLLGLAINYDLKNKKATVKIHFDKIVKKHKLMVYLLEDKLIADQKNDFDNDKESLSYKKGNPIKNFEHNNVLRAAFTKELGDDIDDSEINKSNIYSVEYDLTDKLSKIKDSKNTKIVAFVVNSAGKAINAQVAQVNENKDFD